MDAAFINVLAAGVSAAAAIISIVAGIFIARRAESVTAKLGASERRHASFDTVAEWRRDLREWAAEAVEILTEATYVCGDLAEESEEYRTKTFSCRHRLSSILDRGRFFLPNIRKDEYGVDKPFAYRGYRHSALDPLAAAERVLSTGYVGAFTDRKHALVAMKREFVSSIQKILDPERHNHEVARMIQAGHEAAGDDRNMGGLLTSSDTLPIGAEGMLQNPPSSHFGLRDRSEVQVRPPEEASK
jgi:hypothetical protein